MNKNETLQFFKKAPFPSIMTIISFVLFVLTYLFVTVDAISPYYFVGLIFAIPFVCFGIVTYFTAKGRLKKVTSSIITVIMILVLGFTMVSAFVFIAIDAATTIITDVDKYERVLKLNGYPDTSLIEHFPDQIPDNVENVVFSYNPAFMQGGANFSLKFETDSNSIENYSNKFSQEAKWIGNFSDKEIEKNGVSLASFHAFEYDELPEDFTIYLIDSSPYEDNDWNHGVLSLVAISKERSEIIFLGEAW